jgi:hypothetical protein
LISASLGIAFFDITNAVEGDVFTFYITKTSPQPAGGNMNANIIYGGLTFDAIPEPTSAMALMSGGMIALLGYRRTRKN